MSMKLPNEEADYMLALRSGRDNHPRLVRYPPLTREMTGQKSFGCLGSHTDRNDTILTSFAVISVPIRGITDISLQVIHIPFPRRPEWP